MKTYNVVTQLTKEQAIQFIKSGAWKDMTYRQITEFQIMQDRLCLPFNVFHEAIQKTLNRSVWTHEFGLNKDGLIEEVFNGKEPPTLEEIMNMIPVEKRIVVVV